MAAADAAGWSPADVQRWLLTRPYAASTKADSWCVLSGESLYGLSCQPKEAQTVILASFFPTNQAFWIPVCMADINELFQMTRPLQQPVQALLPTHNMAAPNSTSPVNLDPPRAPIDPHISPSPPLASPRSSTETSGVVTPGEQS